MPLKVANILKHLVVFPENNLSQVFGDTGGGGGGGVQKFNSFLTFPSFAKNTR